MRVLSIDPAGGSTGISGVELDNNKLSIYFSFLLTSPEHFNSTQKTQYVGHTIGALIAIDKPDVVVSEKPFGIGYSAQTLKELVGSIKSSYWDSIKWQGVSEARKAVLGEGYGGADKRTTAEWLLQYPWSISSKRLIQSELDNTTDLKLGYDILDALMHTVCYLVKNEALAPIHKPAKAVRKKKKEVA